MAAGFGGNTSLACIPADVIFIVAKALVGTAESTVESIAFCDGAVDSAEIEGAYERAGHIHADLATHDSAISTQLATHDTDISTQLATHDTDISTQLATHDTDLKLQLAMHDADIKVLLALLQGAVDENQRLIKIFMSRQLEMMRLMITPEGRREVNPDVLTCTGDDCPTTPGFQLCPNGSLMWNCRQ
ncbi:MAG: hypothetical protein OEQ13_09635 [Acidobacteriota bacterium]|nr:hypothetical protein [Acidobacteriota bacterium]